jgi:prevent-host-death family protein
MPAEYSLYDAKAKLSQLVRQVREGATVIITVHGEPAAELRPIAPSTERETNDERLDTLSARGLLSPARMKPSAANAWPIGTRKGGALKRFLEDRD